MFSLFLFQTDYIYAFPPFFLLCIILYLFTLNFVWHFITSVFYNPVSYRARQNLTLQAILGLWWAKYRVASAALNQPWFRPTLGISCQFPTLHFPSGRKLPVLPGLPLHLVLLAMGFSNHVQDFRKYACYTSRQEKEPQPADLRHPPCTCTQMGRRPGITWAVPALPGWFLWVIHYYRFGQKIIDRVEESSITETTLVSKRALVKQVSISF